MMQMSHPWMYGDRRTSAYREGVHSFRDAAEANKHGGGFMFYQCVECRNEKDHASSRVIQSHLFRSSFMFGYNVWTKHGERGVMMEDDDEEENDNDNCRSIFPEYADDIHIDLFFLYSSRPCGRSSYQSNARLLLQRSRRVF
jgi:hypothetical protein